VEYRELPDVWEYDGSFQVFELWIAKEGGKEYT
jgi:hypothetical protein